jgi:hypothetical protein
MQDKANEHTKQVTAMASDLELLEQQYDTTTEKYRLDMELTPTQRQAKIGAAKQQVTNRLAVAESLRQQASETLAALLPTPEPASIDDPLALFLCQHRLYSMKSAQRLAILHKAIESSDRLTYDAIVTAPPWLSLVSDLDIRQGKDWWNERHNAHPSGHYQGLSAALESLSHVVTRLRCRVA